MSVSTDCDTPAATCKTVTIDQISSGGQRWNCANHVDRRGDVSLMARGFELAVDGAKLDGLRADPFATLLNGEQAVLGVYAPKFWQNFPKRLRGTPEAIELELFPHRPGEVHELQGGEQKTHEFWIAEGDAASPEALERLRARVVPRITPEGFAESQCINFLTLLSGDEDANYQPLVHQAVEGENSFFAKREQIDEYGWRHFGDAYGDHEAAFSRGTAFDFPLEQSI